MCGPARALEDHDVRGGPAARRINRPVVVDGAINGDLFVAYLEQQLVPTLKPADVVVMDNLSRHKRTRVREAIEAAGCSLVYLPPYSPDLNPIELAFAKLKSMLRSAGKRTVEALWNFLGEAIDAYSPQECANYFRHCGHNGPPPATLNPKTDSWFIAAESSGTTF